MPLLRQDGFLYQSCFGPFINQPIIWDYLGRWDPDGMNYYFRGSYRGNWKLYRYNSVSKKQKGSAFTEPFKSNDKINNGTNRYKDVTSQRIPLHNSNTPLHVVFTELFPECFS